VAPAPFIVGVARSGTTLLRLQLDAHPELALPPETGFGALARESLTRNELADRLAELPTWADLGLEREAVTQAFADASEWSTGEGLRACYRLYAARHEKERWGDKTPGHASYMREIAAALPEARFIHLIRDGRDVAASLRGLPFAPGDGGIVAIARHWRDTCDLARRSGAEVTHYIEVRYEELVAQPEATLRTICEFIELEFDERMLHAHERAEERLREMRSARVVPGGSIELADGARLETRTSLPPDRSRAGRWRTALTEHEVARFERFAAGMLVELGYEPSYAGVSERLRRRYAAKRAAPCDRSGPMRIVIGAQWLAQPGGTETYVATVATELERLGHEVTVLGGELGPMADWMEAEGARLARRREELPPSCDAALAQDSTMAAVLAERYPDARLVYVSHSDRFDPQTPILVPDVVDAVVALSDRVAARMRALALDVPIIRMRHPIDTYRFARTRSLPPKPRRALILSNYLDGAQYHAVAEALARMGVVVDRLGVPGRPELDPRPAMEDADIVVAKARAALEAMCVGRAVYVHDQFGGDGWVTRDNYRALEVDGFAGQALPGRPATSEELAAELARYDPDMGRVNNEIVRRHHSAHHHATELVSVLRGPHLGWSDGTDALTEMTRLTRASWRAEHGRVAIEDQVAGLRERAASAEHERDAWRERAAAAEERLGAAESLLRTRRARAGLAIGRVLDRMRGRG
jgi:Sulfotransferase family